MEGLSNFGAEKAHGTGRGGRLPSRIAPLIFLLCAACTEPAPAKDLTACLKPDESTQLPLLGGGTVGIRSAFDGYGCNSVSERDGSPAVHLRVGQAQGREQTHASLVLGPAIHGDLQLSCGVTTVSQTRAGTLANPHEVGWLVWNYQDNDHFYYLAAKPNGWELGRRDPAFHGGQQFLATDSEHKYEIGRRHELRIAQAGGTIDAWIDGEHVVSYTDPAPYLEGRIGFYCEDSEVYFEDLELKSQPPS